MFCTYRSGLVILSIPPGIGVPLAIFREIGACLADEGGEDRSFFTLERSPQLTAKTIAARPLAGEARRSGSQTKGKLSCCTQRLEAPASVRGRRIFSFPPTTLKLLVSFFLKKPWPDRMGEGNNLPSPVGGRAAEHGCEGVKAPLNGSGISAAPTLAPLQTAPAGDMSQRRPPCASPTTPVGHQD